MLLIHRTKAYTNDIQLAFHYIAKDNVQAATKFVQLIDKALELIAEMPALGRYAGFERFPDVRRHVIGNYLLFYREKEQRLEALRLLHGARDIERVFTLH